MNEISSIYDLEKQEMSGKPIVTSIDPLQDSQTEVSEGIRTEVREKARRFIQEESSVLAGILGVTGLTIEVGDGWTTNLKSGKVTVDPTFFLEQDYQEDWVNYAMLHEVSAHLTGLIKYPEQAKERLQWQEQDKSIAKARHLFLNIFTDITGNKHINNLLPRQKSVAEDLYSNKLFKEEDYTSKPRHFQFLYKIIRSEMIPESVTAVNPEVEEAIAKLRNFNGEGQDIIKISTDRFEMGSRREITDEERFIIWRDYIYPVFEQLLEQDIEDGNKPNNEGEEGQEGQSGDDSEEGQEGQSSDEGEEGQEGQSSDEGEEGQEGQSGQSGDDSEEGQEKQIGQSAQAGEGNEDGEPNALDQFESFYKDYEQNRHPEPMEHEELEKAIEEAISQKAQNTPEARAERRTKDEIGDHDIKDYKKFIAKLRGLSPQISEMSSFFASLLDERVITSRKLSNASSEGVILNPNTLAQTYTDLQSGVRQPPEGFLEYDKTERERRAEGRFDCYLAVDCSGSMEGTRTEEAQKAAIVFLEGLAAFEREIRERERSGGVQLSWDAQSCVYAFGSEATLLKPLSHELSKLERLDTFAGINSEQGGTNDYLALREIATSIEEEISKDPSSGNRRRMVFVITDGESSSPFDLSREIQRLTRLGVTVVGIGIQTPSINVSYPVGESIEDVKTLTKVLIRLLESEISR